jgi:hypothetical protein
MRDRGMKALRLSTSLAFSHFTKQVPCISLEKKERNKIARSRIHETSKLGFYLYIMCKLDTKAVLIGEEKKTFEPEWM